MLEYVHQFTAYINFKKIFFYFIIESINSFNAVVVVVNFINK